MVRFISEVPWLVLGVTGPTVLFVQVIAALLGVAEEIEFFVPRRRVCSVDEPVAKIAFVPTGNGIH